MSEPYIGESNIEATAGLTGSNTATGGAGVWGQCDKGRGVVGVSDDGVGVWGHNRTGRAVVGAVSEDGTGVWGEVKTGTGVVGTVHEGDGAGVSGRCDGGDGVVGMGRRGVVGLSDTYQGVYGGSTQNAGVVGDSRQFHAVFGISHDPNNAGIFGTNDAGGFAGRFDGRTDVNGKLTVRGDVSVTGDVILEGADYAEGLTTANDAIVPGMVVVLDDNGNLRPCDGPYDRRVAGIVSGACGVRPAIVLDRNENNVPVALMGKVWAFADAADGPIRCGDLLTTSATFGHAKRVNDFGSSVGAVIGKALTPLEQGRGMVRVLVQAR